MKTRPRTGYARFTLSTAVCAVLAACGGGGGSSSGSGAGGTPTNNSQLTGKAIDGYLPGVTICFDNGQGQCDASLPKATTDANGNYSLLYTGDVTGKHLLAIVPADTTDATSGKIFQTPFVLGAIIGGANQNITPLTSMVVAQIAKGVSQADATTAVQKLAGVAPDSDYIASGNTAAQSLASATVSLLTTYGGTSTAATQNVLNAVIDAGGTAGVTQTLINTEAAATAPHVAATSALASTLYSLDGYLAGSSTMTAETLATTSTPAYGNYVLRDTFSLSGSTLNLSQDTLDYVATHSSQCVQVSATECDYLVSSIAASPDAWTALTPAGYLNWNRQDIIDNGSLTSASYVLNSNGTFRPVSGTNQAYGALTLSTAGDTLSGTDTKTGISYTVSYGKLDVSGQPVAAALPLLPAATGIQQHYGSAIQPFMNGSFASGTTAWVATKTWAKDRIALSSGMSAYNAPLTLPASAASVNDVIGQALPLGNVEATTLTLNADGSATVAGSVSVTGSWKAYAGNSSVLVITLPVTAFDSVSTGNLAPQLHLGHSLVIAYQSSALHQGFLMPASVPDVAVLFDANGIAQFQSSFDAAIKAAAAANAAGIY